MIGQVDHAAGVILTVAGVIPVNLVIGLKYTDCQMEDFCQIHTQVHIVRLCNGGIIPTVICVFCANTIDHGGG